MNSADSRESIQKQRHSNRCHNCKGNGAMRELGFSSVPPTREKLFKKVVTRSDIKQYRLAIPKHQARRHFPPHIESSCEGAFLCMEDSEGEVWRFRYSFWKSSQGYMLTSEWNRFVKEKRVNAGDVISFLRSVGPDKRLYIDLKPKTEEGIVPKPEPLESTQKGQTVKLFGVYISTS
ncbi:hypothetical protein U1Q18_027732 [Sarracenia purpurea var. burkii]